MPERHTLQEPAEKVGPEEVMLELTLRPTRWDDYVGQEKVKENLRLIIDAARGRGESIAAAGPSLAMTIAGWRAA